MLAFMQTVQDEKNIFKKIFFKLAFMQTVQDENNICQKIFFKPAFMQTVQDEKWVIYCPSILKMAGLPPLNSYVYISYQAKHALNFARKKYKRRKFLLY